MNFPPRSFRPSTVFSMRRVTIATTLALGALASTPAAAGGAFIYEVGTEDVGLAAAGYAARAQDATTVFTNPAGMTRLEGQQLQLGTQVLYSDLKFSIGGGTSPALGTNDGGYAVGQSGFVPGGGFFYSYSVSNDLKVGFAATSNVGASLKYDDNWAGRYYTQNITLVGASLLPSIAYRVNEKLSVGASLNAMYGYLKTATAVNNVAPGLADGKVQLNDTKWGFGGNLGLLYELTPRTRFGITYSSEVKLDFSAPVQFSGTGPGMTALLRARGLLNANVDMGITVPQQVMGSFFHEMNDRWALLGNVGWQQWSRFSAIELSVDSNDPRSLTTKLPFQDTWHGALGVQYHISEPWRLNFGVSYDSNFQHSPIVSPILPINGTWRYGVGAENQVSKAFSWGIAGEYIYGGTLNFSKTGSAPVALGGRGDLVGSYDNIGTYVVSANFNWKF